jgi:nucleoside recognition membrane protein YjiH
MLAQEKVRPFLKNKPDLVAHVCNSSYLGARGSRVMVKNQQGQKLETLSAKQTIIKRKVGH